MQDIIELIHQLENQTWHKKGNLLVTTFGSFTVVLQEIKTRSSGLELVLMTGTMRQNAREEHDYQIRFFSPGDFKSYGTVCNAIIEFNTSDISKEATNAAAELFRIANIQAINNFAKTLTASDTDIDSVVTDIFTEANKKK